MASAGGQSRSPAMSIVHRLWLLLVAFVVLWFFGTLSAIAQLLPLWPLLMRSRGGTPFTQAGFTFIIGSLVAALAVIVSFIVWLPTMIVTWITATILSIPHLVIRRHQYLATGEPHDVVTSGTELARELSVMSLWHAIGSGRRVALGVAGVGLIILVVLQELFDGD